MAESTNISYVHHTWSPWRGCAPVSPGCAHCYAAALGKRAGIDAYGKGKPRIKTKDWKKPLRWNNEALRAGLRCGHQAVTPRVLVSLCDWLDDEVPTEWLADFLKLIHDTPNLNWLLLTKRPENWEPSIAKARDVLLKRGDIPSGFWCQVWWAARRQVGPLRALPPANIWLGVSCEDQQRADERIPLLFSIPTAVRWVSFEPLLAPIHLNFVADPDWVVIGGESGPNYRDCGASAIVSLAKYCQSVGVPTYVKQSPCYRPGKQVWIPDEIWRLKEFPKTI